MPYRLCNSIAKNNYRTTFLSGFRLCRGSGFPISLRGMQRCESEISIPAMWSNITAVVTTFGLGAAGWVVTNLLTKPLLAFWALCRSVQEEIIYVANISTPEKGNDRFERAVESLRRLGAQISAAQTSTHPILKLFLEYRGYDLGMASRGLIGLSNSLHLKDGTKAIHRDLIQKGLKLPRDYTDSDIREIQLAIKREPRGE
jgi:hypothetical protein